MPQISEIVSRYSIQGQRVCRCTLCDEICRRGLAGDSAICTFLEPLEGGVLIVSWPATSPAWLPSFVLLPPQFGYPSGVGETSPGEETRKYSKPGLLWLLVTMLYYHRT